MFSREAFGVGAAQADRLDSHHGLVGARLGVGHLSQFELARADEEPSLHGKPIRCRERAILGRDGAYR